MAIGQQQVSVTNAATRLDLATTVASPVSQNSITVRNRGTVAVYIGNSAVTTSTGFQLDAGEAYTFSTERGWLGGLYGITASSTATCHVFEVWT